MKNTARAHTNIALIKYWGKSDPILRLPLMSSLSMTLDAFYTDTLIEKTDAKNEFYLNGKRQNGQAQKRVFSYLDTLKEKFGYTDNLIVKSTNHVPTLARLGSGSASRSIFGGFAIWQKGNSNQSSYAYALDEKPKMDLQLLAVELNTEQKKISSTKGMKDAQSSPFFSTWTNRNQLELDEMIKAIKQNDFTALGSLAELNANEMHAINLTAQPEFTYFMPETIRAIKLVEDLRTKGIECYYTIDAGPNIKVLCQLKNRKEIIEHFESVFNNVNIVSASFGPGVIYLD